MMKAEPIDLSDDTIVAMQAFEASVVMLKKFGGRVWQVDIYHFEHDHSDCSDMLETNYKGAVAAFRRVCEAVATFEEMGMV